jgi:putative phosphoesterase
MNPERMMIMIIAIMSDSHDNLWKLRDALPRLKQADVIIHCGDLCAPFMVRELGEGLEGIPIHVVWGNNDGDTFLISNIARAYPNITLHGQFAEVDLDGYSVAVNHYPEIARALARSTLYDLVCYGHDHTAYDDWVEDCLLLNPGELMGMKGPSSFALVDVEDRIVERVTL